VVLSKAIIVILCIEIFTLVNSVFWERTLLRMIAVGSPEELHSLEIPAADRI